MYSFVLLAVLALQATFAAEALAQWVSLTTPNGGDVWRVGDTRRVQWTHSGGFTSFTIQVSRNGGSSWSNVETGLPGHYTYRDWAVTGPGSSSCRIKVIGYYSGGSTQDTSSSNFTIGQLTITSPNGGEVWQAGTTRTITWSHQGVTGNIQIQPYLNGVPQANITSSASNTGSYSWSIPGSYTPGTTYQMAISAMSGQIWDFSNSNFTIQAPPLLPAPTLTAPDNGATVSSPVPLRWTSVSGNNGYKLKIGSLPELDISSNQYDATLGNGTYTWQVATKNASGQIGPWSSSRTFTVGALPPPTLTGPDNGATVSSPVPLRWTSVSGNNGYKLKIGSLPELDISSNQYDATLGNGTYTWQVATKNASGQIGPWSSSRTFTVGALPPPTLTGPDNGATVSSPVPLRWTSVSGNNGYRLKIGSLPELDISSNQYDATLGDDTYTWQVATKNDSGQIGPWSSTRTFTVGALPAPNLISPADGGDLPGPTYTFTWGAVGGAGAYHIKISTDPTFASTIVNDLNISGSSTSYPYPGSLTWGTTHYWQMRTLNAAGTVWGQWSVVRSFTPVSEASVDLSSPANGATETASSIVFDWNDVPGAIGYEIIVDNNSGMGSPEVQEPGIHWQSLTQSQCEVTNWLPNNVYYWKVIAHLSGGGTVESSVWSFTYLLEDAPKAVWVPLYRFYKGEATNDHFYTTSESQGLTAIGNGYTYERIECYVSDRKFADGTPLMRLYNPSINTHFYTLDEVEKDAKIAGEGYQYEGIQGWVFATDQYGGVPLHRLEEPKSGGSHYFMCTRQNEYESVLGNSAWSYSDDGIAGHVYLGGLRQAEAHLRYQGRYGGVDMATRAFRLAHPNEDLLLRGAGPAMAFKHHYNAFNCFRVPMGPGWSHTFFSFIMEDAGHQFVIVKWGDGREMAFEKNGSGEYIPEAGVYAELTRIDEGVNTGYDLKTKDQTIYRFREFSPSELAPVPRIYLITITDRNQNTVEFDYEASHGLLQNVTDEWGRQFVFTYADPTHPLLLTRVTETALNRHIDFVYDSEGRLTSYTDAKNQTTTYVYDSQDRLAEIIRPRMNSYFIDYEDSGEVTSVREGSSAESRIERAGNTTLVTLNYGTPDQKQVQFSHEDPTREFLLTGMIDGKLEPTDFEYNDTANNPTLPTTVTDRRGHSTHYEYDARGNVTSVTNHHGYVAEYTYSPENDLESSSDFHVLGQTGNVTVFTYDSYGNLTDIDNPKNENTHFTYDARGLVTSSRDGRGYLTQYDYDAYGNLTEIMDPELNITEFQNDAAGRLDWAKDAEGKYTWYDYDGNDNVNEVEDHTHMVVSMDYDPNDNLERVYWTNAAELSETVYGYDLLDRLADVTDPLGRTTTYTYDEDNNLKQKTDRKMQVMDYAYDDNALLESITYPDHTRTITRYENGLVHTLSSQAGTTTFVYDELDRLTSVNDPYGKSVQYGYDLRNNLTTITYPGGKTVTYGYDSLNRLVTVEDWVNGTTTYTYDASGNLTSITRPNNTEAIYDYDTASRLVAITERKVGGPDIATYTFGLDGVGNIESVTATEPLTGSVQPTQVTYDYDRANRLLSANIDGDSVSFTYDNNGNRDSMTEPAGTTSYGWDYENMLTSLTGPTRNLQFVYDGLNNRIARTEDGNTTRYVLDLCGSMSKVLAETDAAGNVTAYYVYGIGLISKINTDDSRSFYHFNQRGDAVALTDDGGNVTDKYVYDEFGILLASEGTTHNPFRFVGRYGVMEEGDDLYFMRARFYDATTGRFLSEDPLGFGGMVWNLYAYVRNSSIMLIDPRGLAPELEPTHVSMSLTYGAGVAGKITLSYDTNDNLYISLGLGFGFAAEAGFSDAVHFGFEGATAGPSQGLSIDTEASCSFGNVPVTIGTGGSWSEEGIQGGYSGGVGLGYEATALTTYTVKTPWGDEVAYAYETVGDAWASSWDNLQWAMDWGQYRD